MVGVLGQTVAAPEHYAPQMLEPIRRQKSVATAFFGWDVWHAYELSWCVGGEARHWVGWLAIPVHLSASMKR